MRILWVCAEGLRVPRSDIGELEIRGGHRIEPAQNAEAAAEALRLCRYDAIVTELPLGEWTAAEWLEQVQRTAPGLPVIFRSSPAEVTEAVRLVKLGAAAYVDAAGGEDELACALAEAVEDESKPAPAVAEPWRRMLVGESRAIERIAETIRLVGPRRSTVLISGETGTGKELVARALHQASGRKAMPFVAINCNAVPETLLEAELFGHVRGAFTGAVQQRIGRFEQANRGTMFLDEIGDMPPEIQTKLLRALQEREIERLGSSETIRLDVRVIAATNADLAERMREGRFREDLHYRLNVVSIRVPPLRERAGDIPALVDHFIEKTCREEGLPLKRIGREALARMCDYCWPGNVRQLEHAVEAAVVLSGDRRDLLPSDFPLPVPVKRATTLSHANPVLRLPDEGLDFERTVSRIERSILDQALARTGGNKKAAAEMLRLKRTTLSAKLKSLEAVAV